MNSHVFSKLRTYNSSALFCRSWRCKFGDSFFFLKKKSEKQLTICAWLARIYKSRMKMQRRPVFSHWQDCMLVDFMLSNAHSKNAPGILWENKTLGFPSCFLFLFSFFIHTWGTGWTAFLYFLTEECRLKGLGT